MNIFKNKKNILLLIFSVVFFFIYNFLNFSVPYQFNSPDENANFVFTRQVAQHSLLLYPLDPGQYGSWVEFIHPRSTFVEEGTGSSILPVGFWGLPLIYGVIGKIIEVFGVLLITPLLVVLAIWAFFGIVKKVFDERIAFWSAFLLFFQPVLWYYTTRSLFPNVPFISLLLIGTWFLISKPMSRSWLNDVVGMTIFMLGILMRPNEIVWVGLCFAIVALWYRTEISIKRLVNWIGVGLFFVLVYALINHWLYGSSAGSYVSSRSVELPTWYSYIFPFGIHPKTMIKTVWYFMTGLVWWYILPAKIGFLIWIFDWYKKRLTRAQKVYGVVVLVLSIFLVLYYGSQVDNLYNLKTIGVAYTRYWLSIFIGLVPFVLYGFFRVADYFKRKKIVYVGGILGIVAMFVLSARLVFGGIDGIFANHDYLLQAGEIKTWVLAHTDPDAILVTEYEDKFFWPDRQVMVRFFDPRVGSAIESLLEKRGKEVYYFGIKLEGEREQKVVDYLRQFGLDFERVENFGEHGLYKISISNPL